MVEACKNQNL